MNLDFLIINTYNLNWINACIYIYIGFYATWNLDACTQDLGSWFSVKIIWSDLTNSDSGTTYEHLS